MRRAPRRGAPDERSHRLGLRARATLAFGTGAALVSMTLAVVTYAVAHHYLLSRRQTGSITQAFVSAGFVQQELRSPLADVPGVLSSLVTPQGTRSLLYRGGRWYSPSVTLGWGSLPASLTGPVRAGSPAEQRVVVDGTPAIAVGVPLPAIGADFYQIRTMAELQNTLDTLGTVLLGTALATTAAGCLIGLWAGRRLMRPLTGVAAVATAIAGGALDRRLPVDGDPDLGSLATTFNTMVESLESRIQRDARFASDVSHELRSPLTAVGTSVELIEMFRPSLPADGQRALDVLGLEVRRFSTMVQDLLEISRMDAGAASLEVEEVPIDELVARTVAGRAGEVAVHVSPAAAGTIVRVDKRRLQRVLANILDNADAYAGGAVLVTVDRNGSCTTVTVDDDGPGIPPGEESYVFERFFRGATAGRRGATSGTGLGLALATEHMRAHGGTVTVENLPQGGARFTLTLPATST
ncbi:MAG TPA: HAMP domain-containing sensor histidine kinase [Acidimicrobiales bacterium]|nr:HAMP domain-containing sensor histidine kinase [Acidimicrobiales bacterium]